ncbi:MAG: hypothetical protein GQ531_09195 [Sulfurovum sp.]|nr:hypothetical protein [Sulfurovum sp.]
MHTTLTLLEVESTFIAKQMASISTATFFEGNLEDVKVEIINRFKAIVKLNPWLSGKIIDQKGHKRLHLYYQTTPSKETFEKLYKFNPAGLKIDSSMPYETLAKKLRPYLVKSPSKMINSDLLVTQLLLIPDSNEPSKKFALVLSMSHSIADGHTYYQIFNMLSSKSKIVGLNVQRKESIMADVVDTFGKKEYRYLKCLPHVINIFKGIILGKKSQAHIYYVDPLKIEKIKASISANNSQEYVSSNDILTSTFSNFIQSRITLMAINFRNKFKGLNGNDAGNYEGAILYDKGIYANAQSIRKSLTSQPYVGLIKSLPSVLEGAFCQMGLITNWSSFCEEIYLKDASQVLHLPITNSAGNAPYEMAVIFRPTKGKLAIIYFSKIFSTEDFEKSDLPISKKI